MLTVEAIPAFSDNYIWLLTASGCRYAVLVDPGDAAPVIKNLRARNLTPCALLITHHHYDHTGGIRDLLEIWPDVQVYGPATEDIPGHIHHMYEGDKVWLDQIGANFKVLEVFGHTAGHIAYYGHDMLFCGDTLFTGGCGKLFEGTAQQMYASLSKLAALPDNTAVYCAHEYTRDNLNFAQVVEPDSLALQERIKQTRISRRNGIPTVPAALGLEKQTNPFLRCDLPSVIKAAEEFSGTRLQPGADVFAVVRHWKDTLD